MTAVIRLTVNWEHIARVMAARQQAGLPMGFPSPLPVVRRDAR